VTRGAAPGMPVPLPPPGRAGPQPIEAALEAAEALLRGSRDPAERAVLEETVRTLRAARAALPAAAGIRRPPGPDGAF